MASIVTLALCVILIVISAAWDDHHLCGLTHSDHARQARIFNGTPVARGEYPWVVLLVIGQELCTGGIINERFVLTAAHCVEQ